MKLKTLLSVVLSLVLMHPINASDASQISELRIIESNFQNLEISEFDFTEIKLLMSTKLRP